MRQWAEEEVIIPSGPFEGRKLRVDRQPYTGLLLEAFDAGHWNRFAVTGPTQSGKTLMASLVPLMYHLFEVGETAVFGLPKMAMASDKWREDILPVIERTRYRELLPRRGGGSRGGKVEAIQFRNGATLRFMSGGGDDKTRAAFATRVVVITEVDGLDMSASTSAEADKVTQIEARTRAFGHRKRVYLECTVTVAEGRIWREYQAGTTSRLALPCPHCSQYVTPERPQLVGWKDAEHELAARAGGRWSCPSCRAPWTEEERAAANQLARLVHRGQQISADGQVTGPLPATETLGFRWTAVNNLLLTAGDVAVDEWKGSRAVDEENAEKELCQFVHAIPYKPPREQTTVLEAFGVAARTSRSPRTEVPADAQAFTLQVDLGKWLAHWAAVAWLPTGGSRVVDYDRFEIPSSSMPVEQAIELALRQFRDERVLPGWVDAGGGRRHPDEVWIDSNYMGSAVYAFCRDPETPEYFRPSIGRGTLPDQSRYSRPKATSHAVKFIGLEYHVAYHQAERVYVLEVHADFWKNLLHRRLAVPVDAPTAMLLFAGMPRDHLTLAKHITAEREVEEYVEGKGTIRRWETIRRANHYLDCLYGCCASAHLAGVEFLLESPEAPDEPPPPTPTLPILGAQPFVATQR